MRTEERGKTMKEGRKDKDGGKDKEVGRGKRDKDKTPRRSRRGSKERDTRREDRSSMDTNKRQQDGTSKKQKEKEKESNKAENNRLLLKTATETATSMAKTLIGILPEGQPLTKEIKQEMIEDKERRYVTPVRSKWRQTTLEGNFVDMTTPTPTPQKRKKDETKTNTQKQSTGNNKKKGRQESIATPQRLNMDRGRDSEEDPPQKEREKQNHPGDKGPGTKDKTKENKNENQSDDKGLDKNINHKEKTSNKENKEKMQNTEMQGTEEKMESKSENQSDDKGSDKTTNLKETILNKENKGSMQDTKMENADHTDEAENYKERKDQEISQDEPIAEGKENTKNQSENQGSDTNTNDKTNSHSEPNTEKEQTQTKVTNPYKKTTTTTPQTTNKEAAVSYSAATKGQTKLISHAKKRGKYNLRLELTFMLKDKDFKNTAEKEPEQFCAILCSILKRAKKVDRNTMINTWMDGHAMRTIEAERDLPFTPLDFRKYLNHPTQDKKLQNGKNSSWRINMSISIPPDLFVSLWEQSKFDFKETDYVGIKMTPLQTERYFSCGMFLNSLDGQLTRQLTEELSEEMQIEIGCNFRSALLDRRSSEQLWKQAYKKARDGMGQVYQHAPLAMNIYTENPTNARKVAKYMLDKYGKQDKDGQYPRLPDGSRMRFLPASKYLDMAGEMTAKNLMKNQIQFNRDQVHIPLLLKQPPSTRFKEHGNKTLTELILDLQCKEMNNEPYFRHIVKQWTRDPLQK